MKYIKSFAPFLMFAFCTCCNAQNNSQEPNIMVRAIKEDRNGNIWFAAWDNVIRCDGKSFTNITGKVGSTGFVSILEDRKGNFWFGTIGSGVYYYNGKSKDFQNFTTREGLVNNRISCIYEDKMGNIWLGANGGVSRYDGKSFHNYIINRDSIIEDGTGKSNPRFTTGERLDNEVHSIMEDKTGKFWFGTRNNAFVYDGKAFTVFTHEGQPFTNVCTILEDKKGNIWLGGNDGLWRYKGNTFSNFTKDFIGYTYEDKKGNIWTSSQSANDYRRWAVSRYDEKSLSDKKPTVTEITSLSLQLGGIVDDDAGNIWFGAAHGMYRYDGKNITYFNGRELPK